MSTSNVHDPNPHSAEPSNSRNSTPPAISIPRKEHLLDWFTYTVPRDIELSEALFPHDALYIVGERLKNIQGYNTTLSLTHGRISYHTEDPEQKICVQFTGRDLWCLRDQGVDLQALLAYACGLEAKITRLDYAVDWYGDSSPEDVFFAFREGRLRSRARHSDLRWGCDKTKRETIDAFTAYLGSEESERQLRCYDKAAQVGCNGPWTRIELVMRDGFGNRVADAMIREGIGLAGNQAIRDFVKKCDIDWFNQAVSGPSVYIKTPPPKERDPKQWLLSQVLPTFERTLESDAAVGDFEVFDAYWPSMRKTAAKRHGALLP